ncbi:hypothetical protein [Klebsiella pneumoniae]|uniref:hypothetical protein n=1 Tax=Klebsiella pneumoniae TaxID=573 RepID=UPI0027E5C32A|nr:hypothetical protein [Klebsiella pneumoniae]
MADWFIATEGVKVVKDSASLWPQIITAVSSAGAALGGVYLAHYFTRRREERAAAAKLVSERLFIATELVFLLEQFAEDCAQVATDNGVPDRQGEYSPVVQSPDLTFLNVSGDWRTLSSLIMYRVRELPVLQSEARRDIAVVSNYSWAPYHKEGFQERQYQYARLGLKALILSRRLRKLVHLPGTRLDATKWSAQPVLWQVWRQERHRRARELLPFKRLKMENHE